MVRFGAEAGLKAMIARTGRPIKKKTRYVWINAKYKRGVRFLPKEEAIDTPGAGFARAGWARAGRVLGISPKFGYAPGGVRKSFSMNSPFFEAENRVRYVPALDSRAGGLLPGIPHRDKKYHKPHTHPKSYGIVDEGQKKASAKYDKEIAKTIKNIERAWRR